MKEKYFYLDCLNYYFRGYTFECYWNGWSCPSFTMEVCKEILKLLDIKYSFNDNVLTYIDEDWDELITLTPNEQGLYSLGAWSWCWSEISEEELKEEIWQSYKGDIIQF